MQVLVTVERLVSVVRPHKIRSLLSTSRALISTVLTATVILALNVSFLTAPARDINFNSGRYCFDDENFRYQQTNIWPWIYLSFGYFIPWMVLLFGNVLIVIILQREINNNSISLSMDNATTVRKYKVSVVTKRVIALNAVYSVCVSPMCILAMLSLFGVRASEPVNSLLTILMLVNNSVSFLYILLGSNFKQEVVKMMSTFRCTRFATAQRAIPPSSVNNTRF